MGQPGKCYQKVSLQDEKMWAEVICPGEITKKMIGQIHRGLVSNGFEIDSDEQAKSKLGETTKVALKAFQKSKGLAWGALDRATLSMLLQNI